jgi:hypothetical protein
MPLGVGNIALLEMILAACRAGTFVVLLEPARALDPTSRQNPTVATGGTVGAIEHDTDRDAAALAAVAQRDFTGQGVELYSALAGAGGRWAASPAEVATLLQRRQAGTFG